MLKVRHTRSTQIDVIFCNLILLRIKLVAFFIYDRYLNIIVSIFCSWKYLFRIKSEIFIDLRNSI
jgi:hypothetical protein